MPLIKQDIVNKIVDEIGFRKNESFNVVDDFFNIIKSEIISNKDVKLSGFGNFILIRKSPRMGRNPKTKESFPISARTVISFKPGVKLKSIVQQTSVIAKS